MRIRGCADAFGETSSGLATPETWKRALPGSTTGSKLPEQSAFGGNYLMLEENGENMHTHNLPAESDTELLQSFVREGVEDAFSRLVTRHGPMVHRVCLRLLRNASDAQDATQATFIVLARKARSLRRDINLSSWLFGVARRVALSAVREQHRRVRSCRSVTFAG